MSPFAAGHSEPRAPISQAVEDINLHDRAGLIAEILNQQVGSSIAQECRRCSPQAEPSAMLERTVVLRHLMSLVKRFAPGSTLPPPRQFFRDDDIGGSIAAYVIADDDARTWMPRSIAQAEAAALKNRARYI